MTADLLVKQRDEEESIHAAMRADELLEAVDVADLGGAFVVPVVLIDVALEDTNRSIAAPDAADLTTRDHIVHGPDGVAENLRGFSDGISGAVHVHRHPYVVGVGDRRRWP